MLDPRFPEVRRALAAYASDADDPPLGASSSTIEAAVAVVLRGRPDDLDLLLIKRARSDRDPWSGHMALPGGRHDATDESLLHTAVRETREETGVLLEPSSGVVSGPLGALPFVAPSGPGLPPIRISPWVFGVPAHTEARVASDEVAEIHWVSLATLTDPAVQGDVDMPVPGGPRAFPCFHVAGEIVWGLTYRILDDLITRLDGFTFPLPTPGSPPTPR
ncbi:CoA pyrophosphatase [Gaopeijia maritima]|uniref:NUDIX hydrolase n=1 Tax=Gaopeijia maritima TaxID=3119007 RepID=UPI0032568B6E